MFLTRNLQQCREGSLIPIHCWSDLLCDLYREFHTGIQGAVTDMLIDQEDGNILSLGIILECSFNYVRLCLYIINPSSLLRSWDVLESTIKKFFFC